MLLLCTLSRLVVFCVQYTYLTKQYVRCLAFIMVDNVIGAVQHVHVAVAMAS
jgi:hypothetical protein